MCVSKHNSFSVCLKPQAKCFMPILGITVWLHRKKLQLLSSFQDQALRIEKLCSFLQIVNSALKLLSVPGPNSINCVKEN